MKPSNIKTKPKWVENYEYMRKKKPREKNLDREQSNSSRRKIVGLEHSEVMVRIAVIQRGCRVVLLLRTSGARCTARSRRRSSRAHADKILLIALPCPALYGYPWCAQQEEERSSTLYLTYCSVRSSTMPAACRAPALFCRLTLTGWLSCRRRRHDAAAAHRGCVCAVC